MDGAAETGEVCHVSPGVVGGAGDVVLGILMGIAQFAQEASPDFLLCGGIQDDIDTVQSQPVQLVAPFLLAPEGHGIGQGAVVVGVADAGLGFLMDGAVDDGGGGGHGDLIAHLRNVDVAVILQVVVDTGGQGDTVVAADQNFAAHGGQLEVIVAIVGISQLQGEPGLVGGAQTALDDAVDLGVGIICGDGQVGIGRIFKIHHGDLGQLLDGCAAGGTQYANLVQNSGGLSGVVLQIYADDPGFHSVCGKAFALIQSGRSAGGLFSQLGEVAAVQTGVDGVLGVAVFGGVDLNGAQIVVGTQVDVHITGVVAAAPGGVLAAVGDVLGQGLAGGSVNALAVGDAVISDDHFAAVDLELGDGGPANAVSDIVGAGMHHDLHFGVGLFQEGILLGRIVCTVGGGVCHDGVICTAAVSCQDAVMEGIVVGFGIHVLKGDGYRIHGSCLLIGQNNRLLTGQLAIVELIQGGGAAVYQIGRAFGSTLLATGGADGCLICDVVVGRQALLLLLVDLDLADAGPEGAGGTILLGLGEGHIKMGGGNGLGHGEPGLHVAGQGDGLGAEGDQIAGDTVLGIFNGDLHGSRGIVIAAQLDDHLGDGAAHVQLDHGGGRPHTRGLPVGARVAVDDVADHIGLVAAVFCGGCAVKGDIDQLFRGGSRQSRSCRKQTGEDTQSQNDTEYAFFQILHSNDPPCCFWGFGIRCECFTSHSF